MPCISFISLLGPYSSLFIVVMPLGWEGWLVTILVLHVRKLMASGPVADWASLLLFRCFGGLHGVQSIVYHIQGAPGLFTELKTRQVRHE